MNQHARSLALVAAAALALTACSSSGPSTSAGTQSVSAADPSTASSSSSSSGLKPADVDVCSLLTAADASSVALADKLDAAQTSSTVYKLMAMKSDSGIENASSCDFTIDDSDASNNDAGAEGTVTFIVESASSIAEYSDGKKVAGLGDEAYTNENGGTVVRVGNLLIIEGQDSCGAQITLDLLRKIAPNLKSA